jgi:hypothetical protein
MGVPPGEAKALTLWEYEALLREWNSRLDPEGDLEPVTVQKWEDTVGLFAQNPHLLN